jgi:hypothetical protein
MKLTEIVPFMSIFDSDWAEILIFAPFWGRNTPIQGKL